MMPENMDEAVAAALVDAFRMLRNAPEPNRRETPKQRQERVTRIIKDACEPYGADPEMVRAALIEALKP